MNAPAAEVCRFHVGEGAWRECQAAMLPDCKVQAGGRASYRPRCMDIIVTPDEPFVVFEGIMWYVAELPRHIRREEVFIIMATVYRCRKNISDTWHFCRHCSNWPTHDYEERHTEPPDGEKCNQCKAKKRDGNCT
jgi:hypothetical protein